jgi:alcohol dehydrogenase class IV
MYEFHWPTVTLVGPGLVQQLGEHVSPSATARRLLIVAPVEAWARPLAQQIQAQLEKAGWEHVETFPEVEPNPSWKTIFKGEEKGKAMEAQAVLAFGGGSSMDAAKIIADRCGVQFLCTMPTTAGTGGEISPWAVISNLETREKESVVAKWPDLALLDAELTLTVPPQITLLTGIDAFIHGLEAYLSSAATPITDALSLGGMELIVSNLSLAIERGDDLEARHAMLQGSLLTGVAMLHAGLGLMHAIGNVTGGLYHDRPHGLILARCMEAVLEFNRDKVEQKLERLSHLMSRFRRDIKTYFKKLDVPEVEVAQADLPLLVARTLTNVNAKTNPRHATHEEIEAIARRSFVIN